MYVSDKLGAIFVHIPKTGGTAVRELILKPYGIDHEGHRHEPIRRAVIPDGYFAFAFVRNPYRRLASWFRALATRGRIDKHNRFDTFYQFLQRCLAQDENRPVAQSGWIDDRVTIYKFEEFAAGIEEICGRLHIPVPVMTPSRQTNYWGHYDWRSIMDRQSVTLINDHCREDFEKFGYTIKTYDSLRSQVRGDI